MGIASLNTILRGLVLTQVNGVYRPGSVLGLKSALSLTLSLKGEGTVGQTLMLWGQPASTEIAG